MEAATYIKAGMPLTLSVQRNDAGELAALPLTVSDDELRLASMVVRPFFMESEPAFLPRVSSACWKLARTDSQRAELRHLSGMRKLRNAWGGIGPDPAWTSEEIIGVFFNGAYFHHDPGKEALVRDLPEEIGKYSFACALIGFADDVADLALVARKLIAHRGAK